MTVQFAVLFLSFGFPPFFRDASSQTCPSSLSVVLFVTHCCQGNRQRRHMQFPLVTLTLERYDVSKNFPRGIALVLNKGHQNLQ